MTPSLSTREQAAKLYEAAWKAEDLLDEVEEIESGELVLKASACGELVRVEMEVA